MSYRLVKIATFYRDYLNYYYSKNKEIVNKSYIEQYEHIMHDSFGWANFYQMNLKNLGVDAHEIISNAEPLQRAWATEHDTKKSGVDLVTQQIKEIKPDVVFIQDTINFDSQWIENLKREVSSVKLVLGSCCSPINKDKLRMYKNFNFIITCSDLFLSAFNNAGMKAYKLYHAFEKTILKNVKNNYPVSESDLIFIGSLIGGNEQHNIRLNIVEKLLNADINFEIHTQLFSDPRLLILLKQVGYIGSKIMTKLGLKRLVYSSQNLKKFAVLNEIPRNPVYSNKLKNIADKPLYGLDMYKAISNAKMGLNVHGGFGGGKLAANMRLFEITGVGSCLVTDWKQNINELFVPDDEVVTFKNADECIEKVKWLSNNPKEIEKISIAGQKRTLSEHTFENRAIQLNEIIKKELAIL